MFILFVFFSVDFLFSDPSTSFSRLIPGLLSASCFAIIVSHVYLYFHTFWNLQIVGFRQSLPWPLLAMALEWCWILVTQASMDFSGGHWMQRYAKIDRHSRDDALSLTIRADRWPTFLFVCRWICSALAFRRLPNCLSLAFSQLSKPVAFSPRKPAADCVKVPREKMVPTLLTIP